jgi:hypothetical protein
MKKKFFLEKSYIFRKKVIFLAIMTSLLLSNHENMKNVSEKTCLVSMFCLLSRHYDVKVAKNITFISKNITFF